MGWDYVGMSVVEWSGGVDKYIENAFGISQVAVLVHEKTPESHWLIIAKSGEKHLYEIITDIDTEKNQFGMRAIAEEAGPLGKCPAEVKRYIDWPPRTEAAKKFRERNGIGSEVIRARAESGETRGRQTENEIANDLAGALELCMEQMGMAQKMFREDQGWNDALKDGKEALNRFNNARGEERKTGSSETYERLEKLLPPKILDEFKRIAKEYLTDTADKGGDRLTEEVKEKYKMDRLLYEWNCLETNIGHKVSIGSVQRLLAKEGKAKDRASERGGYDR